MPSYLVTGGAGFIGSHLVDQLLAEPQASVTVVDSFDDFYDPTRKRKNVEPHRADPRYRLVESDIRDPEALKPLEQERFDAVIHLAARCTCDHSRRQFSERHSPRLHRCHAAHRLVVSILSELKPVQS